MVSNCRRRSSIAGHPPRLTGSSPSLPLYAPMGILAGVLDVCRCQACIELLQIYVNFPPCSVLATPRMIQVLPSISLSDAMMCFAIDCWRALSSWGWLIRASMALILRKVWWPRVGATFDMAPPSSGSIDAAFSRTSFSTSVTGTLKTTVDWSLKDSLM